jgi:fused signal recognition particle receptor
LLVVLVWRRRARDRRAEIMPSGRSEAPTVARPAEVPPPARSPRERWRAALAKSREAFRTRFEAAIGQRSGADGVYAALEEALIGSDVGVKTASRVLESVRRGAAGANEDQIRAALRSAIEEMLGSAPEPPRHAKPWVILVAGVNGVGKTTSIGKIAASFRAEGKTVLLVAADTFRAAAIDQLGVWAERVGADFVRHQSGADPGAVAFDGIKAALSRDVDIVIVDTAGRLHTRENLMEELRKVARVIGKALEGAPHEVLLVLDASTGQNALSQARVFSETLGVTGIVLTKLDGTAKGGAALAVREELGVPIRYVGVGEGVEDLRPFSAADFAAGLVGDGDVAFTTADPSVTSER